MMNRVNQGESERLRQRIKCLVDLQNTMQKALEGPCTNEKLQAMTGMLRRYQLKE
jgi:hypothetical protein